MEKAGSGRRLRYLLARSTHTLRERETTRALQLIHPFPAPMSPTLTRRIIETVTDPDSVVLDPMAGSGVVPLTAAALGRRAVAFDVDPLSRLMIRTSAKRFSDERVRMHAKRISQRARRVHSERLDRLFSRSFDRETREFVSFWFPRRSIRALLALSEAIAESDPDVKSHLWLGLSRSIIAKSSGVSWALDLPHTRPHRRKRTVSDPFETFERQVELLLRHLERIPPTLARAEIRHADARSLPLPDRSIDLVLTSSPYANAIDYMRSHKFSLIWMGYSLEQLRQIRANMIGSERGTHSVREGMEWLESLLPTVPGARLSLPVLRRFFYDMDDFIGEAARVLRPGAACVLVLGESRVGHRLVDTPSIVTRLAVRQGLRHVGTTYRSINRRRRSLPFPSSSRDALSRRMAREAVVGLVAQ